jgi:hypothetical protein
MVVIDNTTRAIVESNKWQKGQLRSTMALSIVSTMEAFLPTHAPTVRSNACYAIQSWALIVNKNWAATVENNWLLSAIAVVNFSCNRSVLNTIVTVYGLAY